MRHTPRALTVDEVQPQLEELRGLRGYANHRFLRLARGNRGPAHVGVVTYGVPPAGKYQSDTLCGTYSERRPGDVTGKESLCRHCERVFAQILLGQDRAAVEACAQCGADTTYELPLGSHQCEE